MAMDPRLLRPTGRFDPRRIASLAFWLDASDSSTIDTVSDAVSEWRSKVGSGTATQGTAANRPVYTSAGRNGRNVVTFDGVESTADGDWLVTSTLSISQPFTVIWAGRSNGRLPNNTPADGPYVCDGSTSTTRVALLWNADGTAATNGRLGLFAGAVVQPSSGAQAYNQWSVVSAVFNGSSSRLRAEGAQLASGNAGATNITALRLGARFDTSGAGNNTFFEGPWGEFLIYNGALTDAQCLAVERYLGSRWGVSVP